MGVAATNGSGSAGCGRFCSASQSEALHRRGARRSRSGGPVSCHQSGHGVRRRRGLRGRTGFFRRRRYGLCRRCRNSGRHGDFTDFRHGTAPNVLTRLRGGRASGSDGAGLSRRCYVSSATFGGQGGSGGGCLAATRR